MKAIQILGQVLRNHSGSLKGVRKEEIVLECFGLSMRTLSHVLQRVAKDRDALAEDLRPFITKNRGYLTPSELLNETNKVLYGLIEVFSFSVVRHVADSVGADALMQTFEQVLSRNASISVRMIDVAIRLENSDRFPIQPVRSLAKDVAKKIFPLSLLKRFVWFHFYIYEEPRELRQQICKELDLPMSDATVAIVAKRDLKPAKAVADAKKSQRRKKRS